MIKEALGSASLQEMNPSDCVEASCCGAGTGRGSTHPSPEAREISGVSGVYSQYVRSFCEALLKKLECAQKRLDVGFAHACEYKRV